MKILFLCLFVLASDLSGQGAWSFQPAAISSTKSSGAVLGGKEAAKAGDFLLSNSSMALFMPKWPAIATYTAVSGWTNETSSWLTRAVDRVLALNPILTGRVYEKRISSHRSLFHPIKHARKEIWVEPGFFDQRQDFVDIVEAPNDMQSLSGLNCTTGMRHVQEAVIPSMKLRCESTEEDIQKKLPLFQIRVIRFPDDTACIGMRMSHCLGDGLTFFYLFDQLMYFLNDEALQDKRATTGNAALAMNMQNRLIEWNHPSKYSFECHPETFSKSDRRNAYGWPFYFGILRHIRRLIHPTYKRLMILSTDKVEQVKKEYLAKYPKGTRISANDLVTAGLCQSCQSTDIFSFPFNQRGRRADLTDPMAAGYLCSEIPFERSAALEPIQVRRIVSQGYYFKSNELPIRPFLRGRNGRISNFASVQTKNLFARGPSGLEVLFGCMPVHFFEVFPIDVAMIFPVDPDHIGVMHNFDKFGETDLLDRMTAFQMEPEGEAEESGSSP